MGRPKGKKSTVAKKSTAKEEVPNDNQDDESVVDKPSKNGDTDNAMDGEESGEEKEVKGKSGRGSSKGKKASPAKGKKRASTKPSVSSKKTRTEAPEPKSDEEDKEYEVIISEY